MAIPNSSLQLQLRRRLQDKGISANALERRAGLKPSAVQNILQGKSKQPAATLLQAIADELDCSVMDLLGDVVHQDSSEFASIPQEKEISTSDWNSAMYIEALHTVEKLLTEKNIEFTKDLILKYADEIYKYSMHGDSNSIDIHFATWLVDQYSLRDKSW